MTADNSALKSTEVFDDVLMGVGRAVRVSLGAPVTTHDAIVTAFTYGDITVTYRSTAGSFVTRKITLAEVQGNLVTVEPLYTVAEVEAP